MAKTSDMERVAKALGVNPQTIRNGLEQGVLPFGAAVKCERRFSYVFFKNKVSEFLGVNLDETERKD